MRQDMTSPLPPEVAEALDAVDRAVQGEALHWSMAETLREAFIAMSAKLEAAEGGVARLRDSNEKLLGFVNEVMPLDEEWIGDVDGGTMQDAAEKHGLLAPHEVTEPCGDGCNCASYGDFPQTCYRPTGVLRPADAALQEHTP